MTDAPTSPVAAGQALDDLVRSLARASARATAKAGLDLDADDPRVVHWMLLTAFEGLFARCAERAATAAGAGGRGIGRRGHSRPTSAGAAPR